MAANGGGEQFAVCSLQWEVAFPYDSLYRRKSLLYSDVRSSTDCYQYGPARTDTDRHERARSVPSCHHPTGRKRMLCLSVSVSERCRAMSLRKQSQRVVVMDQEELIENVRSYEALYALNHAKYSDISYKEALWKEIGKKMDQPTFACKKTWTSLRDSFRRALRKKREMSNEQPYSKIRKWRFEDNMSFLIPYMHERDKCTDVKDDTDDENLHLKVDEIIPKEEINQGRIKKTARSKENSGELKGKIVPTFVTQFLPQNKENSNLQISHESVQQISVIDAFFSNIATTVKTFSPYYQNIAKSKIFNIISDLEMKQIIQSQQSRLSDVPIQRPSSAPLSTPIHPEVQLYDNVPYYNQYSSASRSPSPTRIPAPSSSYNFSSTATIHHNEKLFCNE